MRNVTLILDDGTRLHGQSAKNGLPRFMESEKIHAEAIIVSDYSENYSHWNAVESLGDWLKREQVPGITGIDTRALTKALREHGVMMGKIVFDDEPDNIPTAQYAGVNYVDRVSCKEVIRYNEGAGKKVVLVDCGVKANILRCLINRGETPTRAMPRCRTSAGRCRTRSSPSSASAWATSSSARPEGRKSTS